MTVSTIAGAQGLSKVEVFPRKANVDPGTKTATVQFINTRDDSAFLRVDLQNTLLKGSKGDPLAKVRSLVSWIQNVPTKVALAPYETLTVKLSFIVPSKLHPGDYSAYLITTPRELLQEDDTTSDTRANATPGVGQQKAGVATQIGSIGSTSKDSRNTDGGDTSKGKTIDDLSGLREFFLSAFQSFTKIVYHVAER